MTSMPPTAFISPIAIMTGTRSLETPATARIRPKNWSCDPIRRIPGSKIATCSGVRSPREAKPATMPMAPAALAQAAMRTARASPGSPNTDITPETCSARRRSTPETCSISMTTKAAIRAGSIKRTPMAAPLRSPEIKTSRAFTTVS